MHTPAKGLAGKASSGGLNLKARSPVRFYGGSRRRQAVWGEADGVGPDPGVLGHTQSTLRDVYMPNGIFTRILGFQVDSTNYP